MKKEHSSFRKFIKAPATPKSKETYAYKIQRFMRFVAEYKYVKHNEDFESLLEYDTEKITDILEEFVDYLESQGAVSGTVKSTLAAPEAFFDMNRRIWHKKSVRKSIQKQDRIKGGKSPATNEDIQQMLKYCERSLRKQAIIHFLASTGIRPAALIDPVLKIKHLKSMPNLNDPMNQPNYCYAVTVYDESNEGYWAFLTPEARNIIDRYLDGRRYSGETIDGDTPLFTTLGSRWNTKNRYLTDDNMKEILGRIVEGAKIPRKKTGKRYDKSLVYMFRKRFNTILKLHDDVNSNIAEKLMAHKNGLDGTYLVPTMEECYAEFVKAIPELTIDPTERQKTKIDNLRKENSKINELERKLSISEGRLEKVFDVLEDLAQRNPSISITRNRSKRHHYPD